jgi:cobalt-zinc-cadmium efflux system outer membrane protein
LQRTIPISDVTVAGAFQNDSTTPGYQRTSYNLNVSVPVPLWDRNQGNIKNALGRLQMNSQQFAVTTNLLTNQLADAFERYQTGRVQAEYYRTQILPDLARAYRGVYERHISNSQKVAFGDIIVAQQNLAGGVSNYISALLTQWIAMTDVANLIQAPDFREMLTNPTAGPEVPTVGTPPPAPREGDRP